MSNYEIDKVFNIVRCMTIQLVLCVSQPIFCTSLLGCMKKVSILKKKKGIMVSIIIIALNVGHNADGTCFVSDGKRDETHWALLAVDLIDHKVYCSDTLSTQMDSSK